MFKSCIVLILLFGFVNSGHNTEESSQNELLNTGEHKQLKQGKMFLPNLIALAREKINYLQNVFLRGTTTTTTTTTATTLKSPADKTTKTTNQENRRTTTMSSLTPSVNTSKTKLSSTTIIEEITPSITTSTPSISSSSTEPSSKSF